MSHTFCACLVILRILRWVRLRELKHRIGKRCAASVIPTVRQLGSDLGFYRQQDTGDLAVSGYMFNKKHKRCLGLLSRTEVAFLMRNFPDLSDIYILCSRGKMKFVSCALYRSDRSADNSTVVVISEGQKFIAQVVCFVVPHCKAFCFVKLLNCVAPHTKLRNAL